MSHFREKLFQLFRIRRRQIIGFRQVLFEMVEIITVFRFEIMANHLPVIFDVHAEIIVTRSFFAEVRIVRDKFIAVPRIGLPRKELCQILPIHDVTLGNRDIKQVQNRRKEVVAGAEFLTDGSGDNRELLWRARRQIYRRATRGIVVTIDTLVDHIDHVAHVAGVDHVGLGSDFDGVSRLPAGLEDASQMPKITSILVERGYTREEIEKILGGNVMRLFGEVCGS